MGKLGRVVRNVLLLFVAAVVIGVVGVWFAIWRSLPETSGVRAVQGLSAEVVIDWDGYGVPRIQAQNVEDLLFAQGYVMAQDRLWQMDLLRRVAAGELSEIFGSTMIELDREQRVLGLRAAAERGAAELDEEKRRFLDAYASGVNAYIEQRGGRLPIEFLVLGYKPRPWTPADSLLISAYMYQELTSTWRAELNRARVLTIVGPERAKEMYVVDSPLDRFVVGGEAVQAAQTRIGRSGSLVEPIVNELARGLLTGDGAVAGREAFGWSGDAEEFRAGSNNWVVSGGRTATGRPLLANDTHLSLSLPGIWYLIHLKAPGYNTKGFALPGGPFVIIGQNERIAWGFTNNGADVQDLYAETFASEESTEYRDGGSWTQAEIRREIIKVKRGADVEVKVVVTRNGPIVLREGAFGYALRWTATEKGGLDLGYPMLGFANNWEEFRARMRGVSGPSQNTVYADVDGNIGFLVAGKIPLRKNGNGSVPVSGDDDRFTWEGTIPFEEMPQALNPPGGIIATANAKVAGPAYRHFLTDRWGSADRTARIYERLEGIKSAKAEDFSEAQMDLVSTPHKRMAQFLLQAKKSASAKDSRATELLNRIGDWDGRATVDSLETSFLEFTLRVTLRKILEARLEESVSLYTWPRRFEFLEMVLAKRPAEWLPKEFKSYDELLMASADEGVKQMADRAQEAEASSWTWGRFQRLEILHPLGRGGIARRVLSIGPMAQPGTVYTVKQTGRTFGPAMRFVADMSNPDNSLMTIATGQSGQWMSTHYKDQFPAWFEGKGLPGAFTDAAWTKASVGQLKLVPVKK